MINNIDELIKNMVKGEDKRNGNYILELVKTGKKGHD